MKYRLLPQFTADYARLSAAEKQKFHTFLADQFVPACDAYAADPAHYRWPSAIRFETLTATNGVLAVTWSFAGPDGRATFKFETVDGEIRVVWRRVGRHDIYRNP